MSFPCVHQGPVAECQRILPALWMALGTGCASVFCRHLWGNHLRAVYLNVISRSKKDFTVSSFHTVKVCFVSLLNYVECFLLRWPGTW